MSRRLTLLARIQKHFNGQVSRTALLNWLLPLSFASVFSTLIAAAFYFPKGYDWRVRVISNLASPRHNPEAYWLPSLGIMVAALLAFPFAGYVAQRMRVITPRLARWTGLAFTCGFVLMLLSVAAQLARPVIGLRWLHEFLARVSAGTFSLGMLGCCICALRDRLRRFGGQALLPPVLAFCWVSLTVLPAACLASIGALILLGQQAGVAWVEDFRQSFRHSMLFQLAFWEWVGVVLTFVFLTGSVLLLPASCGDISNGSRGASSPIEPGEDSTLRKQRKPL